MKVIAVNATPGHEDVVGIATPFPAEDPNARKLTLRTSKAAADVDATWLLTQFLESVAPVIAEEGWSAALSRFSEEDWTSPTAALRLLEDPGNILGPGPELTLPTRRRE
jgi:hypothetical protein